MKNNIVLIGMPGAGKSTVGVVLAKTLGCGFVDTDILFGSRTGIKLQTYIDMYGIDAFLKEEEQVALTLECDNTVIAIEPKKGISDVGLVGVEDTYLVTKDGARCITVGGRDIIEGY